MREIIPLKKDILFKTIIGEITNINLDHDYKIKDNLVEGNVLITGSYKMTEASVLEDDFSYKIPFMVSISRKVNKDTIKIDIDDFKYEIKKDTLSVNIDLLLSCDEEKTEEIIPKKEDKVEEVEEVVIPQEEEIVNTSKNVDDDINDITSNIVSFNENKYYTYKVYIVRENDTIESICLKYNISLDDLKEYNDLDNLKVNDKIIIPYINE